jgi:hypothetical protein
MLLSKRLCTKYLQILPRKIPKAAFVTSWNSGTNNRTVVDKDTAHLPDTSNHTRLLNHSNELRQDIVAGRLRIEPCGPPSARDFFNNQ